MSDRDRQNEQLDAAMARAIEHATKSGADDAEASYLGTETEFSRFASSRFTQVGSTHDIQLRVRVLVGNRLGSQSCASLDAGELARTAEGAVAAARLSPPLDVELAFGEPDDAGPELGAAEIPETFTAARAPAALRQAFLPHADDGVLFAGCLKARRQRLAVHTAAGLRRDAACATTDLRVIGLCGGASGFAGGYGADPSAIDLHAVCARAAEKARRGFARTVAVEPGAYDVVLAPEALSEIFEWMAEASFVANSLLDETSLLTGKQGQPLCDPTITLEDRLDPGEPAFDAEGTLRRPVTFIDAGKGGRTVSDRLFALRLNEADPTGHAPPIDDPFARGPRVAHLRMAPGDASEEELIGRVERGIYVTRFHYVNGLLDTRKATTTGLTRDGAFLIEDGAIGSAIETLRFTEDMVSALGRIDGIGRELRDVPTWWSEGGTVTVPHVLIREFHFTGKSR